MTLKGVLNNKKVLFFSNHMFGYERVIANQLRSFGAIVDYYDERPPNTYLVSGKMRTYLVKGMIKLKNSIYQNKINAYYHNIIKNTATKNYDYLFIIKGEVIPQFFLNDFKSKNPDCTFIFYTWDSFSNNLHSLDILDYFDRKFTFDRSDAQNYNLKFRPLFYQEEYEKLREKINFKYDLLFIGTAHSDRYSVVERVVNWCKINNLSSFTYYFLHSRFVYFSKKLVDSSLVNLNIKI